MITIYLLINIHLLRKYLENREMRKCLAKID